jgi:hypothetical protein
LSELKPGARLRSAVCTTEVMVIQAPDRHVDLRCGGAALVPLGTAPRADAAPIPSAAAGTQVGKRYVNQAGDLELLCTKPGQGSLAEGAEALTIKGAKPLPSSD